VGRGSQDVTPYGELLTGGFRTYFFAKCFSAAVGGSPGIVLLVVDFTGSDLIFERIIAL
jgi:hypothetical protein